MIFLFPYKRINAEGCIIAPIVATSCFCQRKATLVRGRSQTTIARRGRQVVIKCPLFINIHTMVENVNAGGQVVKKSQNSANVVCERPPNTQVPSNQRNSSTLLENCHHAIIDSSMSQGVLSKSLVCSICIKCHWFKNNVHSLKIRTKFYSQN